MANNVMGDKVVHVYGLIAPPMDDCVRYVGITTLPFERRLHAHFSRARRGENTYKGKWIRKALEAGVEVKMVLLHKATADDWQHWERHYIAMLPNLTNGTAGGEGLLDPTPETRQRMREAHLGKKSSPEAIEKRRAALMGNKHMLGKNLSMETRAKISAALVGQDRSNMNWTPEGLERVKDAARGNTNRLGIKHTPETIAKIIAGRAGQVRKPHRPETIAKMRTAAMGRTVSEETRARMSDSAKRRQPPSEDTRRRLSEAASLDWAVRKAARGGD